MVGFGMGGLGLLMLIGMAVAVAVAVVVVVIFVRLLSTRGAGNRGQNLPTHTSARRLLDERYAGGELTSEEYQERVRTLGGGSQ